MQIDYDRVAVTDEQAPLPDALSQLLTRIHTGLSIAGDFIFNCQMGRGRTTTGMVTACLISTTLTWDGNTFEFDGEEDEEGYDPMDGPSEEDAYLQGGFCDLVDFCVIFFLSLTLCVVGEYKTILQLVGVLSHGKVAKRLTDRAIDLMQDVQNLRKAIYEYVCLHLPPSLSHVFHFQINSYKLKYEACEKGLKQDKLMNIAVNYLFVPPCQIPPRLDTDMERYTDTAMAHSSYSPTTSSR